MPHPLNKSNYKSSQLSATYWTSNLQPGLHVYNSLLSSLTGNRSGHGPVERGHCGLGNILGRVFDAARLTGSHHVGLKESSLKVDVVVGQGLVGEGEDLFGKKDKNEIRLG